MNLVLAFFFLSIAATLAIGLPCNICIKWTPKFIQQVFVYGKTGKGLITIPWVKSILVPKRYGLLLIGC